LLAKGENISDEIQVERASTAIICPVYKLFDLPL